MMPLCTNAPIVYIYRVVVDNPVVNRNQFRGIEQFYSIVKIIFVCTFMDSKSLVDVDMPSEYHRQADDKRPDTEDLHSVESNACSLLVNTLAK